MKILQIFGIIADKNMKISYFQNKVNQCKSYFTKNHLYMYQFCKLIFSEGNLALGIALSVRASVRPCVRAFVRACVRPSVTNFWQNFFGTASWHCSMNQCQKYFAKSLWRTHEQSYHKKNKIYSENKLEA